MIFKHFFFFIWITQREIDLNDESKQNINTHISNVLKRNAIRLNCTVQQLHAISTTCQYIHIHFKFKNIRCSLHINKRISNFNVWNIMKQNQLSRSNRTTTIDYLFNQEGFKHFYIWILEWLKFLNNIFTLYNSICVIFDTDSKKIKCDSVSKKVDYTMCGLLKVQYKKTILKNHQTILEIMEFIIF